MSKPLSEELCCFSEIPIKHLRGSRISLKYNTSSVCAGGAYQKCGVLDLILGRPNWSESEEDL